MYILSLAVVFAYEHTEANINLPINRIYKLEERKKIKVLILVLLYMFVASLLKTQQLL